MKGRHWFRFVFWGVAVVVCIAFIWSNSLRNREASTEQSSSVISFLTALLNPSGSWDADIVEFIVRKAAHFSEFALLGFCLSGFRARCVSFPVLWLPILSIFCAGIDEGLQSLSDRSPQISDVCLDTVGAVAGICVFFLLLRLIRSIRGKRKCESDSRI